MNGPALAFAIASPVSIFLNWLLVHGPDKWRIGFLGAPVASVIAYNLVRSIPIFRYLAKASGC